VHIRELKDLEEVRGRKSNKRGSTLEEALLKQVEALDGVYLEKRHEPVKKDRRVQSPKGHWYWTYTAVEGTHHVDFEARLAGGVHASFEAKASAHPTQWDIAKKLHPVTGPQLDLLKQWASLGDVCFVFVRNVLGGPLVDNDYVIPVGPSGFPFSAKTQIQWTALGRWKLPVGATWVDCVRVWAQWCEHGKGAL